MHHTETIKIIQAESTDLEDIFELVRDLALYEKEPESVTTNLQEYKRCFDESVFEAILAKEGKKTIGMALYYTTFSTWKGRMIYLEDFIVKEEFRSKGVGTLLFNEFIAISKKKDAKLAKWQVLDWNTSAVNFYKKKGAEIEKNWWNGKMIF